jgi:hypothetical protein
MVVNYAFGALGVVYAGSFAYLYLRCKDRLALGKYLSNHVLLFAPLNFLFTFFIRGQKSSVYDARSVPGLEQIKENYEVIRAEAKVLLDTGVFQRPPAVDEPGYNTFEKGGWRMYPLKWYTKRSAAPRRCEHARKHAPSWIRSPLFAPRCSPSFRRAPGSAATMTRLPRRSGITSVC